MVSRKISASIVAIGSEITSGKIQDSHGKFLSSRLSKMGFNVESIVLIPDDDNVGYFLNARKNKIDILIITGGLGPTSDDLTREIIANTAEVELVFQSSLWDALAKRFSGKHNESRKRQAYIPDGFTVLENYCGTAPGFYGFIGNTIVFCLPGPPSEMQDMFRRTVAPLLVEKFDLTKHNTLNVSCFLICESRLEDVCLEFDSRDITWGTMIGPYKISLYLQGGSRGGRFRFLHYLQECFGKELIVPDDTNAAEILSTALKSTGTVLCTAESITGGLISKLITDIPGSSKLFWGSLVSYSDISKHKLIGIRRETLENFSAVSKEVVEEMCGNILELADVDISIAVSGYAGGSGDNSEDSGTVWIAVKVVNRHLFASKFKFTGSRILIRRKTAVAAMLLAETALVRPERLDSCDLWQYS